MRASIGLGGAATGGGLGGTNPFATGSGGATGFELGGGAGVHMPTNPFTVSSGGAGGIADFDRQAADCYKMIRDT